VPPSAGLTATPAPVPAVTAGPAAVNDKYTLLYRAGRETWLADLRGGRSRFPLTACLGAPELVWSPTGDHLACGAGSGRQPGKLTIVRSDGVALWSHDGVRRVVWSPTGQHLAVEAPSAAPDPATVYKLLDVTGQQVTELSGMTSEPLLHARRVAGTAPLWSPDGQRFAFRNATGGVAVYTLASGQVQAVAAGQSFPLGWGAGRTLLVAANARQAPMVTEYEVYLHHVATGARERLPDLDQTAGLWLTPDGQHVIFAPMFGPQRLGISALNLASKQVRPPSSPYAISFGGEHIPLALLRISSDSRTVYWYDFDQTKTLYKADIATGQTTTLWKPPEQGVNFSPDGRKVAYSGRAGSGPYLPYVADIEQHAPVALAAEAEFIAWRVLP
ncbi:MAG: hypothetical protein EXR52_06720, partial [Dehalococcoidia bacterium]|nr:hypothetical protein [Dehalococcoidia bacterium]